MVTPEDIAALLHLLDDPAAERAAVLAALEEHADVDAHAVTDHLLAHPDEDVRAAGRRLLDERARYIGDVEEILARPVPADAPPLPAAFETAMRARFAEDLRHVKGEP